MRNQTNGGIFAHVTLDGTRGDSDTNTETNAFVILGMTSVQNRIPFKSCLRHTAGYGVDD